MVGNNLERDVLGANRLGLISVLFYVNERRRTRPLSDDEIPRHTVTSAQELVTLIKRLIDCVTILRVFQEFTKATTPAALNRWLNSRGNCIRGQG
jgi:hypothetical protein